MYAILYGQGPASNSNKNDTNPRKGIFNLRMFHFHTDWNPAFPPRILFSRLVWRKFVAATWDYISQPSTSKQNPIRCYYVRASDITLSSLGLLGRTVSARGGGWRAHGRPVQLHSPHCCCHRGERDYFKNNHTRGGVLLNKGPWHTHRERKKPRKMTADFGEPLWRLLKEARWQCTFSNACAGLGARATNR